MLGVGKLLQCRKDRICDGIKLKAVSFNKNARVWRAVSVTQKPVIKATIFHTFSYENSTKNAA
jgi:hypothetical protein